MRAREEKNRFRLVNYSKFLTNAARTNESDGNRPAKMALVVCVDNYYRFFLLLSLYMQLVRQNHVGELCILNYYRGKGITKLSNRRLLCKIIETQRKKRFLVTHTASSIFRSLRG